MSTWNGESETGGYRIRADVPEALLQVWTWGSWNQDLVERFSQAIREAFKSYEGKPFDVISDRSGFRVDLQGMDEKADQLIATAYGMGMRRSANIVRGSSDPFQGASFFKKSTTREVRFFRSVEEAHHWLARAKIAA